MKNKLLLLATAAVFMSPVAAKANQKSSIYVGLTGTLERLATQGEKATVSDYLKDENYLCAGIEAGYGYKVWNNLQVAGWLRGVYSFEHTFADSKKKNDGVTKRDNDPYAIIVEPRITLGWEFPVSGNISITPFIGAGFEMNWAKTKNKGTEFEQWKVPAVAGVRANFGYVYASVNGRFDLTTSDVSDAEAAVGNTEADKVRSWGIDASIGAEF